MKPFSKIAVIFAREVMMAIIFGALKDIYIFFLDQMSMSCGGMEDGDSFLCQQGLLI